MATTATHAPDAKQLRKAALRYVMEDEPGLQRIKRGRGFAYYTAEGQLIQDKAVRARLDALAIPPAWTEVWICADEDGHIQATGRDEKGRKQYRYHVRWQELSNQNKFSRMAAFGAALPALRQTVEGHLRQRALNREKVLALVIRLLETTLIRIGNPEYARQNEHYGLTTLTDEHAEIQDGRVELSFVGKSGKEHTIGIQDKRLVRLIKQSQDIPGQRLFQYYDSDGGRHPVGSGDVNAYLREIMGEDFTAKDFRTWGGSVMALTTLAELPPPDSETGARQQIVAAVKRVANGLGNTPATCRKYYVHPQVLEAYTEGVLPQLLADTPEPDAPFALSREESALLNLIDG